MARQTGSEAIGRRLSRAREAAGLSQSDIARHLGVSPSAYNRYESGDRQISVPDLASVAGLLGVGVESFITPGDLPDPDPTVLLKQALRLIERGKSSPDGWTPEQENEIRERLVRLIRDQLHDDPRFADARLEERGRPLSAVELLSILEKGFSK